MPFSFHSSLLPHFLISLPVSILYIPFCNSFSLPCSQLYLQCILLSLLSSEPLWATQSNLHCPPLCMFNIYHFFLNLYYLEGRETERARSYLLVHSINLHSGQFLVKAECRIQKLNPDSPCGGNPPLGPSLLPFVVHGLQEAEVMSQSQIPNLGILVWDTSISINVFITKFLPHR